MKTGYRIAGQGNTTLFFIHGGFINKEYWTAQVDFFGNSYRVITIDLAGHGKSAKERNEWSVQGLGEEAAKIIMELNLSNLILIGHSLGGDVMLEIAKQVPDSILGLVGIDTFKNAGTSMPLEIRKQTSQIIGNFRLDFSNSAEFFVRQALVTSSTNELITDLVVKDFRNFDPEIGVQLIASSFSYFNRERELLKQLNHKLYLINVDFAATNEELLKKYAKSGFEIFYLKGTCHFPMIENPKEFNLLLKEIAMKIMKNTSEYV
jgi:sigma-B regulation protein RsbQ